MPAVPTAMHANNEVQAGRDNVYTRIQGSREPHPTKFRVAVQFVHFLLTHQASTYTKYNPRMCIFFYFQALEHFHFHCPHRHLVSQARPAHNPNGHAPQLMGLSTP